MRGLPHLSARESVGAMKSQFRPLVIAATTAALLVALPATASAAARISLGVSPGVPAKGKSFQINARGTAENPSGGKSYVLAYLAQGDSACASSPPLDGSTSNGIRVLFESVANGGFIKSATVSGGPYPFASGSGVKTGRYRACGYVTDQAGDFTVRARDRLEFTVGGTCAKAKAKVATARRQLRKARKALRKARRSGSRARARRARKAVSKARKRVKSAKARRRTLC
jgi:hypothetical protein